MPPSLGPDGSPPFRDGLFRTGEHVDVRRSGSAIAILHLERGTFEAATPDAADVWGMLVEGRAPREPPARAAAAAGGADALARIAEYLLGRPLIEPSDGDGKERR